jgi:hypothetical protein
MTFPIYSNQCLQSAPLVDDIPSQEVVELGDILFNMPECDVEPADFYTPEWYGVQAAIKSICK